MNQTKKGVIYQEEGKCPFCGSNNLDYGDSYPEGDDYCYDFVCENCGTMGKEWYLLKYDETTIGELGKLPRVKKQ